MKRIHQEEKAEYELLKVCKWRQLISVVWKEFCSEFGTFKANIVWNKYMDYNSHKD